ncbi:hypothetical protein Tco_0936175 [Tanacetum coccineum]
MKIEHYLAHTDYPIWEVIQNGNGPVSVTTDTSGQIKILPPKTGEEIVARERERKARTTLLMAIPEDHLAKFHKMTDAKEMINCIQLDGIAQRALERFQRFSRLSVRDSMEPVILLKIKSEMSKILYPSACTVSLIRRTTRNRQLSYADVYNNLRVF